MLVALEFCEVVGQMCFLGIHNSLFLGICEKGSIKFWQKKWQQNQIEDNRFSKTMTFPGNLVPGPAKTFNFVPHSPSAPRKTDSWFRERRKEHSRVFGLTQCRSWLGSCTVEIGDHVDQEFLLIYTDQNWIKREWLRHARNHWHRAVSTACHRKIDKASYLSIMLVNKGNRTAENYVSLCHREIFSRLLNISQEGNVM